MTLSMTYVKYVLRPSSSLNSSELRNVSVDVEYFQDFLPRLLSFSFTDKKNKQKKRICAKSVVKWDRWPVTHTGQISHYQT